MAETEHRWPCERCGADLRFAPGATALKCDHCGHIQALPDAPPARQTALEELDLNRALHNDLPPARMEEVRITPCPSCGAQVEFQGAEHATQCPFCASPVAIGTGTQRLIKPQAVLPFALTERQGREAMTAWLGSLWFAPNGLVEYARKGRTLAGLYVPYWTYDAATRSRYAGARGDYYYETRTVTVQVNGRNEQRQQQVRKTRWRAASGWVSRRFDDVLVLASTSLPRRYTDGLAPWDLGALLPYSPDYLAGFTAEGYTVSLADGQTIAREVMAAQIAQDIRRDIGGDEQRIDQVNTAYSAETFKHILLPIWMAAYKYNGKTYRFVVNGQTGKVQGERPWSAWKIAFAVLFAAIVIGGVAYLGGM
ncbi:primosomal protein N' (replication factor Y) - superfamily II helicase [Pseudorhodobacter sp. MZDSW-24AT]|uniref:primosomal protein N' (replication factor Y) - superfamily II helicase n=1 Tax=Pseudorhodobacter sp. MZDSW-24AT TaxID=2052957 RepID=UPI000C1EE927|nr:primosomal protein N' (replication factor Y) - superfamily II helicase [Pseudorhodobacter sp. MZDSW-24AT]PJF09106.1 primosomal protein N' (replication factor Y) - superfamily II helicase [Pseudorhodobacter sp. MZDSW-24AT]